jgi:uncharacterized DUF497 family protein
MGRREGRTNLRKHGIDFATAVRAFFDPLGQSEQDRHVNGEERWQRVGLVRDRLTLVAYTTQDSKDGIEIIRIISARFLTPGERRRFEAR